MSANLLATLSLLATLTTCTLQLDRLEPAEQAALMDLLYTESIAVDTTLNTPNIWLDISALGWLDQAAIDQFLVQHPEVSLVKADSVLAHNPDWQANGTLPQTLIRVSSPEIPSRNKVIIPHTKFRSQSGGVILKTILLRKHQWEVVETEMVGIS